MEILSKQMKAKIDFVVKIVPVLSIIMIFFGYLFVSAYYAYFGIDILIYLDVKEILTAFLPFMEIIIPYTFVGYIMVELINWNQKNEIEKAIIGFILFLLIIAFFLSHKSNPDTFLTYSRIPMFFLGILITFYQFIPKPYGQILFVILFYISGTGYYSDKRLSIEKKWIQTKVSFSYEGSQISSNDTAMYIGQTRNYLFLYNFKSERNYMFEFNKMTNFSITKHSHIPSSLYHIPCERCNNFLHK